MALSLGQNSNNGWTDHGDIAAMNGATALTLAFWVAAGAAVSAGPIRKATATFFQMDTGRRYWVRDPGVWDLLTLDGDQIPPDVLNWNHFGLVYDGSLPVTDRITVYKNAVSQAPLYGTNLTDTQGSTAATTAPTSWPSTSPNPLQVGNANTSGLHGHLRLWNAALTQAEVAQEMHRYWASRQTNLLLDAPYDDQLNARDYSGTGNHGTWNPVNGTPDQRQGPPIPYGGKVLVTG